MTCIIILFGLAILTVPPGLLWYAQMAACSCACSTTPHARMAHMLHYQLSRDTTKELHASRLKAGN
jgi:hypothetical protein